MSLEEFLNIQRDLFQVEKSIEIQEIQDKINVLSSIECEQIGLSILSLKIDTIYTTIFGKFTVVLSKLNLKDLPSGFKVGDEISLRYYIDNKEKSLISTITKITSKNVEINIENLDEGYDDIIPPVRIDKRVSEVTYKKIFQCISTMKSTTHPLLNLAFHQYDLCIDPPTPMKLNKVINDNLNQSQIDAIESCLGDKPLGLIHGPPGTGKTSTITELILQCAQRNMKVLVCAPSNIAVDNILERLIYFKNIVPFDFGALRLGHPARINNEVYDYCLDQQINKHAGTEIILDIRKEVDKLNASTTKIKNKSQRKEVYREINQLKKDLRKREKDVVRNIIRGSQIILTTCIGADTSLLKDMNRFDMVVIDECAQGLEIETWIPILLGNRCVLAGDHCQLPPVVKSVDQTNNLKYSLSISLFERLIQYSNNRYSNLIYLLNIQYRMNDLICKWSSQSMYKNKLISHSSVSGRSLNTNQVNSSIYPVMTLIDTTGCDVFEELTSSGSHSNLQEAVIVKRYVYLLLSSKLVNAEDIGVITPYNGQVNLLKELFRELNDSDIIEKQMKTVMIRTVDGYQGGEKECIIMSLVRSNNEKDVGFLSDTRRMNVSVTRSKKHFCLVGNKETCENNVFLNNLFEYIICHGDYRSAVEYLTDDWVSVSLLYEPTVSSETDNNFTQSMSFEVLVKDNLSDVKKSKSKKDKPNKKIIREFYFEIIDQLFADNINVKYDKNEFKFKNNILTFSYKLTSNDRKNIHKYCEDLGLHHRTIDGDKGRFIEVSKYPFESSHNTSSAVKSLTEYSCNDIKDQQEKSMEICEPRKISNNVFEVFSDGDIIDGAPEDKLTVTNQNDKSKGNNASGSFSRNKEKNKEKISISKLEVSEEIVLMQAIHQNEMLELDQKYRIPAEPFPNPDKIKKLHNLQEKIKQSENGRKSKSKKK